MSTQCPVTKTQLPCYNMFIDGKVTASASGQTFETTNPANGQVIGQVAKGTAEDVQRAVEAADLSFPAWSVTSGVKRGLIIEKAASLLLERLEEFAQLETADVGKPIHDTRNVDVTVSATFLQWYGKATLDFSAQTIPIDNPGQIDFSLRQPYGVVGLIAPWNFPLVLAILKIGPALAAGNTAVMLPSDVTSLTTCRLAQVFAEAGLPPGVLNVVTGPGPVVGEAICQHPKVKKIFFTGSTRTSQRIIEIAKENMTDVALELGGKSPNIIFADADWEQALSGAMFGILFNNGQNCIAGSRLLVEKSIYCKFVAELAERFKKVPVGDPLDPATRLGPLVSKQHYDKVNFYLQLGKEEGAKVLCGGGHPAGKQFESGYFVEPTLFAEVTNDMRIAREEIFGPVQVAIPFEGEQQAVEIANDTAYGLGSGVFTSDINKAHRMIKAIESGTVYVNTYNMIYPQAPFPAWKQSGNTVERGLHGLLQNTRYKNVVMDISGEVIQWP